MESRLRLYSEWTDYFSHESKSPPDVIVLSDKILWKNIEWRHDNNLKNQNSTVFFHDDNLVMKIISMHPDDFLETTTDTYTVWKEISTRLDINNILHRHNIIHYPFIYAYDFCLFNSIPSVMIIEEHLGIDFRHFILQNDMTDHEWLSMLIQLFFAHFYLASYLKISHKDPHWGNVLIRKCENDIRYKYNDENYLLSNQAFHFYLCDFGHAETIVNDNDACTDYIRFVSNIFRWIRRYKDIVRPPKTSSFISRIRVLSYQKILTFDLIFHDLILPLRDILYRL